ncbi:hypothetical protein GCM10018790_79390 [Kitasatospora xanthocidica]|nr:hypothetical protein GCM10018790_79390 [Kitasatospora xanthocidica]
MRITEPGPSVTSRCWHRRRPAVNRRTINRHTVLPSCRHAVMPSHRADADRPVPRRTTGAARLTTRRARAQEVGPSDFPRADPGGPAGTRTGGVAFGWENAASPAREGTV